MSTRFAFVMAVTAAVIPGTIVSGQEVDRAILRPESGDRIKTAVVQYESGRIMVVREVQGELQVIEPQGDVLKAVASFLQYPSDSAGQRQATPRTQDATDEDNAGEDDFMFFSPAWYGYPVHYPINTNPHSDPGTERIRQKSAERVQEVEARRKEQNTTGIRNRAGRVYPLTAGEQEQDDRLERVRREVGSNPYVTFYSLGDGLEYFRQRELAARKELALLTYDVLLAEGLELFHNRQYGQAARSLIAATQKDQGDAGSRLQAAQALMASGLYDQAIIHVRRAFELAPLLLHRPLNHRSNYSFPQDYDEHLRDLSKYVETHPGDDDAVLLLAYQLFYSSSPADARGPMTRVKELARHDRFAHKLWEAARPMLGDL